jgi:LuxR family transcriptional regulator, maltose regulon positive regulatory protein
MASWYMRVTQARQGQVFLWSGDLEQAVQWAEQQSLQPDDEVSHVRELQHLVYTRILIAHHCYDEALALLNRLLTMTETDTRLGSAIELHLIKAMLLHRQKQSEAAVQEVAQALLQAEAGGYITLFVQEGTLMAELMRNAVKLKTAQHSFSPDYAKRVLAAFPDISPAACAVSHPDLLDNLSDRELEVLRYLAKGFRNQEIADSLYISLNTVKTHLKHIHSKLDVNNRTEAVARGREIGLL